MGLVYISGKWLFEVVVRVRWLRSVLCQQILGLRYSYDIWWDTVFEKMWLKTRESFEYCSKLEQNPIGAIKKENLSSFLAKVCHCAHTRGVAISVFGGDISSSLN